MKKNKGERTEANLIDKIQYGSLLLYFVLMFIMGGGDNFRVPYIPLSIFMLIELGFILETKTIRITKHILAIFMFCLYCLLTCVWAQESDIAITRVVTLFLLAISLAFMFNYCKRTKRTVDDVLMILLVSGISLAVYMICFYGPEVLTGVLNNNRIGSEIDNVNSIGMELATTSLIAIYYGMNRDKRYYLLSVIPIVFSLSTASKKAIICILVGLILLIIFKYRKKDSPFDYVKKVVLPVVVLAVAVIIIQANVFPTLTKRLNMYSNSFTGEGRVDVSTEDRNTFVEYGLRSFWEHPLFGIGVGNSNIITMEAVGQETYLHNNYIELLATTGIVGAAIHYYTFISMLIYAMKSRKECNAAIVITILLACLILDWGMVSYYEKLTYAYILLGTLFYSNVSDRIKGVALKKEEQNE